MSKSISVQISVLAKFDWNPKPNLIHCAKAEAGCRRSHFPKEGTKQKTTVIAVNCTLFKEDRRFRLPHKKWCKNRNNIITKHHRVAMTIFYDFSVNDQSALLRNSFSKYTFIPLIHHNGPQNFRFNLRYMRIL